MTTVSRNVGQSKEQFKSPISVTDQLCKAKQGGEAFFFQNLFQRAVVNLNRPLGRHSTRICSSVPDNLDLVDSGAHFRQYPFAEGRIAVIAHGHVLSWRSYR